MHYHVAEPAVGKFQRLESTRGTGYSNGYWQAKASIAIGAGYRRAKYTRVGNVH